MAEVRDLDILRPARRAFKLHGEEIDVSFIPSAIIFDVQPIMIAMSKLDTKKLANDTKEQAKAFEISLQMCAVFCEHDHPEMTEAWFRAETNVEQVGVLARAIQEAYTHAYDGVEPDPN